MYAIIEDSGVQYRVARGDVFRIDLRQATQQPQTVEFDRVLMVGGDSPRIGAPYVEGVKVVADVVDDQDSEKTTIFKFRRRKNYRRKVGHRQHFLRVKVTDIIG
jgi:large subunit ribosomal protein L21